MNLLTDRNFEIYLNIPNPIANFLIKKRLKILNKYWVENITKIESDIKTKENKKNPHYSFKWTQLVTQELRMWVLIGKLVSNEDLEDISSRRGLSKFQIEFIKDALTNVKLYKENK